MYIIKLYKNKSSIDGFGLFAAEFIPKGTIVYYYGCDDTHLSKEEFQSLPKEKKEQFYSYGVEDEAGDWLLTNGDANHSCDANILSLFVDSLYCDIAVKDIHVGDEITIDYGLFYSSIPWSMRCNCGSSICRETIVNGPFVDIQTQTLWFSRISEASSRIFSVKQRLFSREDERAKSLTEAIKSKTNPVILPFIKFSLISAASMFNMGRLE